MIKKSFIFAFCALVLMVFALPALAAEFNPDSIISDEEILDSSTMSLADIQEFLENKGSYLANYKTVDAYGVSRTAAEIIFYAATDNYDCSEADFLGDDPTRAQKRAYCDPVSINPRFLLVLLQKEQSLIEDGSPSTRQLNWATGYGCPDGQACNDRWRGFGKQVNSAALQFFDYMKNPAHYTYRAGNSYAVSNTGRPDSIIFPQNQATAALYNYTPHVYNGNYNFYKLWIKYFTRNYPNNTLVQAKGEPGIWLIRNGKKRPFLTRGALSSRFDINKVIQVNKSELDKYPKGAPIKFPNYSLVRSPRGTIFLLVDEKRRGIASQEAFRLIGFNPEEVLNASWEDINSYEEGSPITASSTYPTGALLQDNKTGGVYWVSEGTKAPLWDAVLLKTKYRGKSITPVSPEKLASYETVEPAIFNDGELLKGDHHPAVYIIDKQTKRPISSGKVFESMGYSWDNIITVPKRILEFYPDGEPLNEIFGDEADIASGSDEILAEEVNNILNP